MYESGRIDVGRDTLDRWQGIVDILAEVIGVPSALVMRLVDSDIEVFVSSKSSGNPYIPGDREHFLGSGLYCETVIRSNDKLLIPNALEIKEWENNPDVKLNMISYLGYPILFPDGSTFGTICVLDSKENYYSKIFENLIMNFREMIQYHLSLIYMNRILGEKNKDLSEYIEEIRTLRGIIPICAQCKKIRNDEGYWMRVEKYIEDRSDAKFTHGLCEECAESLYGDQEWFKKRKAKLCLSHK